jgi:hypothetical protein
MLAIVNVSDEDTPAVGINQYEVRINYRVIATFEHDRQYGNAAECLRDAADAVERCNKERQDELLKSLLPLMNRMK